MQSQSFQAAAWRRLKKNKGAVIGLIVIMLSVLVAIFAYFIAPDHSPSANRIILEIREKSNPEIVSLYKNILTMRLANDRFFTGHRLPLIPLYRKDFF